MQTGKNSILVILTLSIILFSGWASVSALAQNDLSGSLTPEGEEILFEKRADINGMVYRLFHLLLERAEVHAGSPLRKGNITRIFNIMNL